MKFVYPVPSIMSWVSRALLSLVSETWHAVHSRVALPEKVWGTLVENAMPLIPSAEIVCCW